MSDAGAPWEDYGGSSAGPWADYAAPQQSVPAQSNTGGILRNVGAGIEQGVTGAAGFATNMMASMTGYPGESLGLPNMGDLAAHALNKYAVAPVTGLNPEDVTAKTLPEKLARGAGMGLTALVAPEAEGPTVASLLAKAATGAASGVGATAAQEAVPDRWKPLAALIGGFAGGFTPAALKTGALKAAGAVRAAVEPVAASVSDTAAQRMAGTVIRNAATSPEKVSDLLQSSTEPQTSAVMTQANPSEIVPGSRPTTFQQTGDVGLGSLERGVAARNPDLFAARRADQNAARLSVLGTIQNGGSAADVASAFRGQLDALDQQTAAHAGQLLTQAQAKAEAMGGAGTPEHYGDALRTVVKQADDATRERESELWRAVDPKGDLTGNVTATRTAAQDIADGVSEYAKPMSGEEAAIFKAAQGMKAVQPVGDLIALRSRVSTEMRNELAANGRSSAYARLTQLRGAIQNNLSQTISEQATEDAAEAAQGNLPQDQTLGSRLEAWRNEWAAGRNAQQGSADLTGTGAASVSARSGTQGQGNLGFGGAAGVTELSPSELADARTSVKFARSPIEGDQSLFQAIKKLGGISLKSKGPDVGEIRAVLKDVKIPGLVNSAGLSPDYLREALAERGWFGGNPSEDVSNTDLNDLYAIISKEAQGEKVFHPNSEAAHGLHLRDLHNQELAAAGVGSSDNLHTAAHKLASFRRNGGNDQIANSAETAIDRELQSGMSLEEFERLHQEHGYEPGRDVGAEFEAPEVAGSSGKRSEFYAGVPQKDQGIGGQTKVRGDVSGNGPLLAYPTFDAAAADRLKAATAATREQRGTFARGPVGQVLARAGMQDLFRLPEARVPEKFFHPGPTGFTDMQALSKAIGVDKATPLMADYAASSLRKAALRDDGTIDPAKFSRWRSAHADSLRALPADVRDGFSTAPKASQAVQDASVARAAALKTMQSGALGRLMGATTPEDATRHIASIFGTKDSVAMMRQIAKTVSGDPAATAGLRQAVADHIASKFISNTEAGTSGQNLIKSDMFQSFLKNNRAALGQVFKPDEMKNLQAIADDLHRANRSIAAVKLPGGSNTAQDILSATRQGVQTPSRLKRLVLDAVMGGVGFTGGGLWGAAAAGLGAHAIQAAREAGITRVDQLVTQAMLDPKLAAELLKKAPAVETAASDTSLARAIRRSFAGTAAQMIGSRALH